MTVACTSSCATGDHDSYGACLRSKNLQVDRFALAGNNEVMEKRKTRTLDRYAELRAAGLEPRSPLKTEVDRVAREADSA